MAQTNVMVSYAPERRPVVPAAERGGRGRRRWGAALTGVLLAGGAVFALGTFVRPDGSLRDTGLPSPPRVPLATAEQATAPEAVPTSPPSAPPESEPAPLPYLALVRDTVPGPAPPIAAPRAHSRSAPHEIAPASRRVAMRAIAAPLPEAGSSPAQDASLALPPAPEPVTGQRRDLEGFLGEQGLVLTDPPPPAADAIGPVAEWSASDLTRASVDPPPATPDQAAELATTAPAAAATLKPGMGAAMAETVEDSPAGLVEIAEPEAPRLEPTAEDQRLTGMAPGSDGAALSASLHAVPPRPAEPVARLVLPADPKPRAAGPSNHVKDAAPPVEGLVPPPAPAPLAAGATAPPAASIAQSFPLAVVNGEPVGAVTLRDLGAHGQAVHLGALVGLLKLRMPEAEFARLSSAAAADRFVTLDQLRAAGITVQFDAREGRLLIDAR